MGLNISAADNKDKKTKTDKSKDKKDSKSVDSGREVILRTTPYDPRFPNQNQTRNCYQNYLDYHRCLKVKDDNYCQYYQWAYRELCPKSWYEKWDDQRANGLFAGKI